MRCTFGFRIKTFCTNNRLSDKNFSPRSKKIIVDIDKKEIVKRKIKSELKINSDVGLFLESINAKLNNRLKINNSWIENLSKLKIFLDENNKYKKEKKFINSFRS